MKTQTKDKLRGISYLMMVLVVYSHGETYGWPIANLLKGVFVPSWDLFLQYWIFLEIPRFVVPLFFGISGYFLVANRDTFPTFSQFYVYKLRSRLRSVLVPYVVWSIASVLLLALLEWLPLTRRFHHGKLLFDLPLAKLFSEMFVTPIAIQLWFLQELMVLVIAVPLFLWMASRIPWLATIILGVAWLSNQCEEHVRLYIDGLFFFYLGILWVVRNIHAPAMPCWLVRSLSICWLGMTFLNSYLYMVGARFSVRFIEDASEIIGIVALWYVYDAFPQRLRNILLRLSPYGFFLYIVHIPYQVECQRVFFRLIHPTTASQVAGFLLIPLAVIVSVTASAPLAKRYCGPVYRLLTGGR